MTASANIKTPSMDLPVKPGKKSRKHAKQLQRKFTKVTLAQVSHTVSILSTLKDECSVIYLNSLPFINALNVTCSGLQ